MLAIIDEPWTREMLSSALAELNPTNVLDLYRAFPLMLALLESVSMDYAAINDYALKL